MKTKAKKAYIYKIINLINSKVYIGQTTQPLAKRFRSYARLMTNEHLKASILKHGFDNFKFEVLFEGDDPMVLDELEIYYISTYEACDKTKGYNIEAGGRNARPSAETLAKMSLAHKGAIQDSAWVEKRIFKAGTEEAKKYGKAKTEEEKTLISEKSRGEKAYWFGKKRDPEMVKRMAESKRGKAMNPLAKSELLARQAKKVEMTDANGLVTLFESQTEASTTTGISVNSISSYCKGKFKNKQGLVFKYV